jgi:hypothetical protein
MPKLTGEASHGETLPQQSNRSGASEEAKQGKR